jgi:hypothetical protein
MKRLWTIFWILCAALPLAASGYAPRTVKIKPLESYPARIAVGTITIAADPYPTDERSFSAFDVKHLNSRGYFPIHVIVQNLSSDFLIMRTRNIVLVTSSGEQLFTTPISVLVEDIFKASSADKLSKKKSAKSPARTKVASPLTDFSAKDLTNKLVDPGKISDGFLFFYSPDPKQNIFAGSTLFIPKLEEEGTRKSIGPFSIPMDPALSKLK